MSSHREAPEISKDPVADSTDVYAFVSPDQPKTVTLISNYVPLQNPAGGPNFYEFGDDVLYSIYIDNDADGVPEIAYVFEFNTTLQDPDTFLYNTGPIAALDSPTFNRRQFYSVTRVRGDDVTTYGSGGTGLTVKTIASNLPCPPCNIGPASTPNYAALAASAVQSLPNGIEVYAGQRREGFYVDLGAIFDLADLRPFQSLFVFANGRSNAPGVNATAALNVHTIAIQVPITELTSDGTAPKDVMNGDAVIGVWASASRRRARIIEYDTRLPNESGPWVQVSRLGNPLFNEVVVPLGLKDVWNTVYPVDDSNFRRYVAHPEVSKLLPVLYPNVFPNLAGLKAPRADLIAILLTGIPSGIIPGFQNYTGSVLADQLRLNVAVPPTTSNPSIYGILGGDLAGYPNGRRVFDDVVSIDLRAFAGLTYPLVDPSYKPDGAASLLTEGLTPPADLYQSSFPYLAPALDGFDYPSM